MLSAESGTAPDHLRFAVMARPLHHLSPAVLCLLAAGIGGLLGGAAAVRGLHQNAYGPVAPPALAGWADRSDELASGTTAAGAGEEDRPNGCTQCSERDLGYRWAALAAIRSPGQCPNDSWGFRRGCLDYIGGI